MHMLSQRKRNTDETSLGVEDYYQQNPDKFMTPKKVHLHELLLTHKNSEKPDGVKSLASKVYEQLKAGKDFDTVSAQYSNCSFSDWKYFVTRDEILDSTTRKLAFSLSEGEYSNHLK